MSNTNINGNWYETEVGKQITSKKYLHDGEDFYAFVHRVSGIFSEGLQEPMVDALFNGDFFPAGRSLYGAGAKGKFRSTLSNCYIMESPKDNIEDIFDTAKKTARIFSMGGGVGINVSKLRPRDAKVNNAAKTSTGAVSFLNIFNSVGEVIGANNRRAALMLGLECTHPDIEEFLTVKQNNTAIQSANLSILFTDDFMRAVRDNEEFPLMFEVENTGEIIGKTIDAKDFFQRFCESNWDFAEPGMLFIDNVRNNHLLSGYPEDEYKIDICNPCFTGDMRLLTMDGYKTFAELNGRETYVRSYDGSISLGKIWCSGEKETVKVKMGQMNTITCTPDHVFMTVDKQEVMAKDLKGVQIMPFLDSSARSMESLYEKLGFIQGDGQLTRLKSNVHQGLEVNIGDKDSEILDLFEHTQADMLGNGRSIYVHGYNETLKSLKFSSEPLPTRVFPKTYESWIPEKQSSFLRGCYSANGCVMSGKAGFRIQYKTTCKTFANQLVFALADYGISSYITTNKPKKTKFNNGDYVCKESYDINIADYESKRLFYNTIGFIQSYKDTLLFQLLLRFAPKVTSIKPNGIYKVYDFSEPKNHWGVVEGVVAHNCAEYTGSAYNACNLGSINLYNMVDKPFTKDASFNFGKFRENVILGVKALDEILDYGLETQPLPENQQAVIDWRAIGLGIFGLADMFIASGIKYGSQESIDLMDKIMDEMVNTAMQTSALLAKDKGSFAKYNWERIRKSNFMNTVSTRETFELVKKYGLRNGSLLSIAPTGSIGTMCGLSGGCEPLYAISYDRTTHALEKQGKNFRVFAKSVDDFMKSKGINKDNPAVTDEFLKEFPYITVSHDINPLDRVKLQATIQKYIDNAISSTVNLKNSATVQDVIDTYMYAWESGCKGLTVFRDGCARTSILGKTTAPKEEPKIAKLGTIRPIKRSGIKVLEGKTIVSHTSCVSNLYTTVNFNGSDVFEVFTNANSGCKSNISTITRLASLALRSGVAVDEVVKELKGNDCSACGVLKRQGKDVSMSCGTAIGEAIESVCTQSIAKDTSGLLPCPECKENTLQPQGKCYNCSNCGYSKCD